MYNINITYLGEDYLYMKNILTEENMNKLKEELEYRMTKKELK